MDKNSPYRVTEWEWIKLKCAIYSARIQSKMMSVEYLFRDSPKSFRLYHVVETVEVVCKLHGEPIQDLVGRGASREEQLKLYRDWVAAEKQQFGDIVAALPVLSAQLNVEQHVAFVIMHSHGMGALPLCTFVGDQITWRQ
jgi:hypothetical protein